MFFLILPRALRKRRWINYLTKNPLVSEIYLNEGGIFIALERSSLRSPDHLLFTGIEFLLFLIILLSEFLKKRTLSMPCIVIFIRRCIRAAGEDQQRRAKLFFKLFNCYIGTGQHRKNYRKRISGSFLFKTFLISGQKFSVTGKNMDIAITSWWINYPTVPREIE